MDVIRQILEACGWRAGAPATGWAAAALAAGYLAAAALAVRRARGAPDAERPLSWLAAAGVCALVAAQLAGMPEALADAARVASRREGWYEERGPFQAWLSAGLCAGAVVAGCVWRARRAPGRTLGPVFARLGALAVFAAVRAVSLHEVDAVLNADLGGGVGLGRVAELALVLALAAALVRTGSADGEGGGAPPGEGPLRVF